MDTLIVTRYLTYLSLTSPTSTQEFWWIPANCFWEFWQNEGGWPWDRPDFYPRGVAPIIVTSCYRNRLDGPFCSSTEFTIYSLKSSGSMWGESEANKTNRKWLILSMLDHWTLSGARTKITTPLSLDIMTERKTEKNVAFCDRGIMAEIILKKFKVGVVHRDLKKRKDLQR